MPHFAFAQMCGERSRKEESQPHTSEHGLAITGECESRRVKVESPAKGSQRETSSIKRYWASGTKTGRSAPKRPWHLARWKSYQCRPAITSLQAVGRQCGWGAADREMDKRDDFPARLICYAKKTPVQAERATSLRCFS